MIDNKNDSPDQSKIKNTWVGYHVQFRDRKITNHLLLMKNSIDGVRWSIFSKQDRPYKLNRFAQGFIISNI